MDITGLIVAGVLFFISIPIVGFISILGLAALGAVIGKEPGAAIGGIIGWIVALCWWAFAIINIIIRIVELIQVLTGSNA